MVSLYLDAFGCMSLSTNPFEVHNFDANEEVVRDEERERE